MKKYSKDDVLNELIRVSKSLNVESLREKDFRKNSKISLAVVQNNFGSWNEAIREAGLVPTSQEYKKRKKIDDHELLEDLIRLHKEYGKEPTGILINAKGKFSARTYMERWGSTQQAFLMAKNRLGNEIFYSGQAKNDTTRNIKIISTTVKPKAQQKEKRLVFGEPINFRGLRFAPVNEQGVVFLFGMLSHELGYHIEIVRTDFPDCEGKRCFDKVRNQWEHIKIEFEYKSSNFREHGHDENECDIIVCWVHDWTECPLEVLELRSTIQRLNNLSK